MAAKNKEIRDRFVAKITPYKRVEPVRGLSSVYTTFNEVLLDVRYSALLDSGNYWFFIDTHRVNAWRGKQRFLECLVCGDESWRLASAEGKAAVQFGSGISALNYRKNLRAAHSSPVLA